MFSLSYRSQEYHHSPAPKLKKWKIFEKELYLKLDDWYFRIYKENKKFNWIVERKSSNGVFRYYGWADKKSQAKKKAWKKYLDLRDGKIG